MSTLVITLPARSRDAPAPAGTPVEYAYAIGTIGGAPRAQGRAAAAALPRAQAVVLVVPPTELSWHRLALPRAPAARLRVALGALLEEHLLDDDEQVHLAVEPGARAGAPAWIAAVHRPWLKAHLAALEHTGASIDRVVPQLWPAAPARGHFFEGGGAVAEAASTDARAWLALADADGVQCLPLASGLARACQARWRAHAASWSALPAVAGAAERWLGAPVTVCSDAEAALRAAQSPWNLRQFDLAPQRRGTRALREAARRLLGPSWRAARWGVAALLLVQLVGLNLWAWRQRAAIDERQQAAVALLRSTHPQVRAVLDAPAQMQRENELLRQAAGRAGDGDFEPLLALAARAWPDGQPAVQMLRFEPGRLSLAAAGWAPEQLQQFRARVQAAGLSVEQAEAMVTIARNPKGTR